MGKSFIEIIQENTLPKINISSEEYEVLFGQFPFTPEVTIVDSEDFNCGAVCNELEWGRLFSDYVVDSFALATAEEDYLEELINAYINLPRLFTAEGDEDYRDRFRALSVANTFPKRITRWAIYQALEHVISDAANRVEIYEPFDIDNTYFEVRVVGYTSAFGGILFLDTEDFESFLDIDFLGGLGTGQASAFFDRIVSRIKAAGVDFDVLVIQQGTITKTSDATIV